MLPDLELPQGTHPLTMRSRHLHDEGGSRVEALVMCALTGRARSVGECNGCRYHAGGSLRILAGKAESRVLCRRQPLTIASDADTTRASIWELLPPDLHCIDEAFSIVAALSLLREKRLAALPVVNATGQLSGIVSRSELTHPLWKSGTTIEPQTHVAAVMRQSVGVPETATIAEVVATMSRDQARYLPIVGIDGKAIGVVTALDIVRWVAQHNG